LPRPLDQLAPGDELPTLHVTPTLMQAVMYAAAMWEFQRIHFDPVWAREAEGLDGAILQGPMLGNYLTRAIGTWARPPARLARLTWRNRGVAPLDEALRVTARVEACHRGGSLSGTPELSELSGLPVGKARLDVGLAILNPRNETILAGNAWIDYPEAGTAGTTP